MSPTTCRGPVFARRGVHTPQVVGKRVDGDGKVVTDVAWSFVTMAQDLPTWFVPRSARAQRGRVVPPNTTAGAAHG